MDLILRAVLRAQSNAKVAHPDRPFVLVTWAQSMDAMVAATPGKQTLISGKQSMQMTHALRAIHDAILVGIGTVLADDPRLSCRMDENTLSVVSTLLQEKHNGVDSVTTCEKNPTAVVLDSSLRTPVDARFLHQPHYRDQQQIPFLFADRCLKTENVDAHQPLKELARILHKKETAEEGHPNPNRRAESRIQLQWLLSQLQQSGIGSVMVEGGASVISSFLDSGLCDMVVATISPSLFGEGVHLCSNSPAPSFSFTRLSSPTWTPLGDDVVVIGTPS